MKKNLFLMIVLFATLFVFASCSANKNVKKDLDAQRRIEQKRSEIEADKASEELDHEIEMIKEYYEEKKGE